MGPVVGGHHGRRVGGVLERAVLGGDAALFDVGDLAADGDHGVAEAVELDRDSLSVGSIMSVPGTGQDMVGAW